MIRAVVEGLPFGHVGVSLAKGIGLLVVVVTIIDIGFGHAVRIAGGVEDGACGIHRFGRQEHAARHIVQDAGAVGHHLPRFVERTPTDNGGVRIVAGKGFKPLGDVGRPWLLVVIARAKAAAAPIAKFAPHQIAETVGMVEEAFFKDFLVQARPVEACGHAQFDVADQGFVAGRGHNAIRIVALIQHKPLKDHFAVDLDRFAVEGDAAQPSIAVGAVDHHAIFVEQLNLHGVEMGVLRRPQAAEVVGNGQSQMRREVGSGGYFGADDDIFTAVESDANALARFGIAYRLFDAEGVVGNIGRDARALQMRHRHRFQPDGLPDAGCARIETAIGCVLANGLLATRLYRAMVVASAYDNSDALPGFGDVRQVTGEAGKAAAMATDLDAVDPNGGVIIYGLKVEQGVTVTPFGRNRDGAAIPHGIHKVEMVHAGEG